MKTFSFALISCVLLSGCVHSKDSVVKSAGNPKQNMIVAQSGKTAFTITLAADAIPAEKTGAEQLQKYLQQVTGATLPIKSESEVKPEAPQILVGAGRRVRALLPKQDWSTLGSDGIVLKSVGNNIILAGGRPRGTLYAVFQFLEDAAGCRWWTPTERTIPRKSTLVVPTQDTVYRSPFEYREIYATGVQQDSEFATVLRQNGHHQQQGEEWGGHHHVLGFVHTFSELLPPEKYFKQHPEWYTDPNNGGKPCTSNSKMPEAQGTQLCLTNPQVLDELTTQALAWIEKRPDAGYISISQNDNDVYCRCPDCSRLVQEEGSEAGPILNFVNKVAARIYKQYPDFRVETLAYRGSEAPPKSIRPAKNVLIRLAPMYADFGHPFESEANKRARENVKSWSKIAPRLFIWNYVTNFNSTLMPHPNWSGLGKDLRFFAANNSIGVFEQGNAYTNGIGDFAPLREWLVGRLLWNPQLDQDKLTAEFMSGYYGPAAPFLKKYIDLVQQAFLKKNMPLSLSNRNFSFLTLSDMNRATRLFAQAASAVKGQEDFERRLQHERLSLDAAWLVQYRSLKHTATRTGQEFLGPDDGPQALARFVETAKSYSVKFWGEAVPLEKHLPVVEGQFRATAQLPEFARKYEEADVIDIQDSDFRLHNRGVVTNIVTDAAASDQKAANIIGDTTDWAVQAEFNRTAVPVTPEKWHLYALVRATLKPGARLEGAGLNAGIYDDVHPPKSISSQPIALKSLISDQYQLVDLGVHTIRQSSYLWLAPERNLAVENFYVDRVILIRDRSE